MSFTGNDSSGANSWMPKAPKTKNYTAKLDEPLSERVEKAMQVEGWKVFAEFCRVALNEKCRKIETDLKASDPDAYHRIYGSPK